LADFGAAFFAGAFFATAIVSLPCDCARQITPAA